MTATPTRSPWPAPSLSDLVLADSAQPAQREPNGATTPRRTAAALLSTAKRLSSRSERAEFAAAKQVQRIKDDLIDLPAGWYVLHSFGFDDSDEPDEERRLVDHVALGPGGVFMIYLDHQLGAKVWVSEHKVTINGSDSDRLRAARFEARRASGRLSDACGFDVAVQSVLVLIGVATMQTLSRPAEVHVRDQYDLRDWLCKQPTRLDGASVWAVYEHLRPAETPPCESTPGLVE